MAGFTFCYNTSNRVQNIVCEFTARGQQRLVSHTKKPKKTILAKYSFYEFSTTTWALITAVKKINIEINNTTYNNNNKEIRQQKRIISFMSVHRYRNRCSILYDTTGYTV